MYLAWWTPLTKKTANFPNFGSSRHPKISSVSVGLICVIAAIVVFDAVSAWNLHQELTYQFFGNRGAWKNSVLLRLTVGISIVVNRGGM